MAISIGRRQFISALGGAVTWPFAVHAQQGAKRVGVLMTESEGSSDTNARVAAFEATLKELGWTPGRNLQIDYRWAMGDSERIHSLAVELVSSAPDLLVAVATPSLVAMQKATHTIPIVFVAVSEPVANGFVPSLSHPGGNATGFSNMEPSMGAKWLELLLNDGRHHRFVLPSGGSCRSAVCGGNNQVRCSFGGRHRSVMRRLNGDSNAGLIFPPEPFTAQNNKRIVELANNYRLPAVYPFRFFADAGGLASYGTYLPGLFRPAAVYVDRILKGEHPGDLPVQQPTKFLLVINLKTAKALGLTVPQTLLATADEVIE